MCIFLFYFHCPPLCFEKSNFRFTKQMQNITCEVSPTSLTIIQLLYTEAYKGHVKKNEVVITTYVSGNYEIVSHNYDLCKW